MKPCDTTDEANARRIEACVNALVGVPTDVLERATSAFLINDHHLGVHVQVNCGRALPSRGVKLEMRSEEE